MTRCTHCGRKLPCQPCDARDAQSQEDAYLDTLQDQEPTTPLLVWFKGDLAREHLNRLVAEWPYELEVITPELPEDMWGCVLARRAQDIGRNPIEYTCDDTRLSRDEKPWFVTYFERDCPSYSCP
jgi:hypothetical protein